MVKIFSISISEVEKLRLKIKDKLNKISDKDNRNNIINNENIIQLIEEDNYYYNA